MDVAAHCEILGGAAAGDRHGGNHRIAELRELVVYYQTVRELQSCGVLDHTVMFEALSLFSTVHLDLRMIEKER